MTLHASSETIVHKNQELLLGDTQVVGETQTLLTGPNYLPGSVLGRITATGKWTLSLSAAVDGSEVPRGILPYDVDASLQDVVAQVFKAGLFNQDILVYGAGHDQESVQFALEGTPLFITSPG